MNRELFLKDKEMSESTRKSYDTLFKRIEVHENLINKNIEEWDKEDCLEMLANTGSKKYNTIAVKWSLLKKYLIYIGNTVYRDINKYDLEEIESSALRYIPYEEVVMAVDIFDNYIDRAIVLLLRNGIKGEEIRLLKTKDINVEQRLIKLENRVIELDEYTMNIVDRAIKERGYKMYVRNKSNYDYYFYNMDSEFFVKNRKNKYNNNGLDGMKENATKDRINKTLRRMDVEGISTTSLIISYAVDRVIQFEDETGMILTEKQVKAFIDRQLNIQCNFYTTFILKNERRESLGG